MSPTRAPIAGTRNDLDGVLIIDKPAGPTSHDVVARVRRLARTRRIGHVGTLDPFATGVLPLVLGRATRLARFLGVGRKAYRAEVHLGLDTTTHDVTGEPVPASGRIAGLAPTRTAIEAALSRFHGPFEQVPPAFSAKKVRGVRAYELARQERAVTLDPVRVEVYDLELERVEGMRMVVRVDCSPGFYVRALARDLGALLGCGAHLVALRRIRSGEFGEGDALPLEMLEREPDRLRDLLRSLERLLTWMPAARLTAPGTSRATHGNPVAEGDIARWEGAQREVPESPEAGPGGVPAPQRYVRLLGEDGRLVAVAVRAGPGAGTGVLQPSVVLV